MALKELQAERDKLKHLLATEQDNLEALRHAAKRAAALIELLQKHDTSAAEQKLLPLLRQDHKNLVDRANKAAEKRAADEKHLNKVLKRIKRWRKHHSGQAGPMFDSIDLSQFPSSPRAVAGYTGGFWPTYNALKDKYPNALKLSIAIRASDDADCLDVEPGDASVSEAAGWVKRQKARGVHRPAVYCSVSQAASLLQALNGAGLSRSDIRLWTAHYTYSPHRCDSGCGYGLNTTADATQWTDHSGGHNLDESLCSASIPWHK